jgi:cytochrome c
MKIILIIALQGLLAITLLTSCGGGGSDKNIGIGPVKELILPEKIDQAMVAEGKKIYEEKCTACHKPYEKYIGPAQAGVLKRRTPEWVMNMILNPEEMIKKDPIAKELMAQFASPMANQNLTQDEARKIVEYFRTLEEK